MFKHLIGNRVQAIGDPKATSPASQGWSKHHFARIGVLLIMLFTIMKLHGMLVPPDNYASEGTLDMYGEAETAASRSTRRMSFT
jgi:hypothetical protein